MWNTDILLFSSDLKITRGSLSETRILRLQTSMNEYVLRTGMTPSKSYKKFWVIRIAFRYQLYIRWFTRLTFFRKIYSLHIYNTIEYTDSLRTFTSWGVISLSNTGHQGKKWIEINYFITLTSYSNLVDLSTSKQAKTAQ